MWRPHKFCTCEFVTQNLSTQATNSQAQSPTATTELMSSNQRKQNKPRYQPTQEGIQDQIKHLIDQIENLQEQQDQAFAQLKYLTALQRGERPPIQPSKKSRRKKDT